ncbi:DUF2399 domain-containing protein [Terrabacter sp. BE26]|uniref:DUF2399 domain-containing protein n=1 Tax=Terrabacter sp. BE26 TaxID=2898152 RepID=UPI0035BE4B2F
MADDRRRLSGRGTSVDADAQLPLDGTGRALWDPELTTAMHEAGWAVHKEVLLPVLLTDLRATEAAPPHSPQPPAG